jgi:hypothetical protein
MILSTFAEIKIAFLYVRAGYCTLQFYFQLSWNKLARVCDEQLLTTALVIGGSFLAVVSKGDPTEWAFI